MNPSLKSPFIFLSGWRSLPPYEMISYILMYASVPMLAFGLQTYNIDIIKIIILINMAKIHRRKILSSGILQVIHGHLPIGKKSKHFIHTIKVY